MSIEQGARYQISQSAQEYFNHADSMTVIANNGVTIQFTLADGKGYGSMPVEHLDYLMKKSNLTLIPNKKSLLNSTENNEEQIG